MLRRRQEEPATPSYDLRLLLLGLWFADPEKSCPEPRQTCLLQVSVGLVYSPMSAHVETAPVAMATEARSTERCDLDVDKTSDYEVTSVQCLGGEN